MKQFLIYKKDGGYYAENERRGNVFFIDYNHFIAYLTRSILNLEDSD